MTSRPGRPVLPGDYSVRITVGDHTTEGLIEVRPDPRKARSVAMVEANLEIYWTGQGKLAELRAAIRRLDDTQEVVSFYSGRIDDWDGDEEAQEDLKARTDSLKSHITGLLDRLRLPDGEGIRSDTTITNRLGQAVNEATGSPFRPSTGRRDQVEWAMNEADELLEEIERFYVAKVAAYKEARRSAGFDPLG